jgi:hypothetical protein
MERQTTIKKLFHEEGIQFAIPAYQRAYSWELDKDKKQIEQFIIDIKDQNPKKKYFLGHFLFEKDENKETKFWVIDGQQRLTTVIIFFTCLINELEKREKETGILLDNEGNEIEVWRIKENYIRLGKNYKFETVAYDNPFFESFVYDNNDKAFKDTSSSRRISVAKGAFENLLKKAELNDLLNWKKIIDDAVITTFEVTDKVQATQIFAFQNDRGKDLTTLEKLKAFLMHKLYAVSENDNPESQIKNIETVFSDIYKQSERISFSEDQVLGFHNTAFLMGWDSPLKNVKDELNKIPDNSLREKWIKDFINNLKETFVSIELIEKQSEQNCSVSDVLILDTQNSMPLLVKLYHYHKNDHSLIEKLSKLIERILFKLEYKIADYRTNSLHSVAKHYLGNTPKLEKDLTYYVDRGFQDWWNFNCNSKSYFNNNWHYHGNIKYVLWKYENHLRQQNRTRQMTPIEFKNKFNAKRLENTTDHITPRDPNFTKYTEDFQNKWVNNIGNLVLMVWGDNSEKKNNNPIDKVNLFDSDFYSHKEIRDTLNTRKTWGEQEISERKDKILTFIFHNWNI